MNKILFRTGSATFTYLERLRLGFRIEPAIEKRVHLQIVCPDDHYYNASLDACAPGNPPVCEKGPSNWYRGDSSENHGNSVVNQCRIKSCLHNFRFCRRFRLKKPCRMEEFITARIRRMGKVMFSVSLSVHTWGGTYLQRRGVPTFPGLDGGEGYPPSHVGGVPTFPCAEPQRDRIF